MATNPDELEGEDVAKADRRLRDAIEQCRALLKETDKLLRESQQDNEPSPRSRDLGR